MVTEKKKYPPVRKALKKYYGYDSFRPGQPELIKALLDGRDVLGIMPTGAGKSVCYQIPAIFMPGITLVISPLISLMKDQVAQLNQARIPAAFLNSSLSAAQYRKALAFAAQNRYKIIYVAPERLATPQFLEFAKQANISMIAVDEAHCVSQWGQNFRPHYLDIAQFAAALPKRPVMAAFTATATGPVKSDILKLLDLHDPEILITGFDRPNLYFAVEEPDDKFFAICDYLEKHPGQSGIIYCLTRADTEEVAQMLCDAGFPCKAYHAGVPIEERSAIQDDFQFDRIPLIAATCAFGMGIDKSNVRFVLHYSMPGSLEAYYQEAGRAGRDGAPAECILFHGPEDYQINKFLIERSNKDSPDQLTRDLSRLHRMYDYCHTDFCLRSFILEYFNEPTSGSCSNCSNCLATWKEVDVTEGAAAVYKLVRELPRPYGKNMLRDLLRGSHGKRITSANLDKMQSFGALQRYDLDAIKELLDGLLTRGFLSRSNDAWQVVSVTPAFDQAIRNKEKITLRQKLQNDAIQDESYLSSFSRLRSPDVSPYVSAMQDMVEKEQKNRPDSTFTLQTAAEEQLYGRLKTKRLKLSRERGLPPYVIFPDATLLLIARNMPLTEEELSQIEGIGAARLENYGKDILNTVRNFLSDLGDGTLTDDDFKSDEDYDDSDD